MKYDDVMWHEQDGRPDEKAVHIGYYMQWVVKNGLGSSFLAEETGKEVMEKVASGSMSGYDFLVAHCGGALVDEDLNDEGRAFTGAYYKNIHILDLEEAFPENMQKGDLLRMPYSQSSYRRLADILDRRLDEWRRGALKVPPKVSFFQNIKRMILGTNRR